MIPGRLTRETIHRSVDEGVEGRLIRADQIAEEEGNLARLCYTYPYLGPNRKPVSANHADVDKLSSAKSCS